MKKRLVTIVALILIVALTVFTLVGCDEIFTLNKERDAHQVVASVSYKNQSSSVYKYELESSFNSYAYLYVNYYGMTYEGAANYISKSLAQRELLVMFAKEYLAKIAGGDGADPNRYDYYVPGGTKNLLSSSEYDKAIRTVNNDLQTRLNEKVQNSVDEENRAKGTTSDKVEPVEGNKTQKITLRFMTQKEDKGEFEKVSDKAVNNGATTTAPEDPTRDGYKFYGWYRSYSKDASGNETFDNKVDFTKDTFTVENWKDSNNRLIKLYAKWEKYTAPRTEFPAAEEETDEADKNYNADFEMSLDKVTERFINVKGGTNMKYYDGVEEDGSDSLLNKLKFKDFENGIFSDMYEEIDAEGEAAKDVKLKKFIDDGIASIKKDLKDTFTSYDYYLTNEFKSLLTARLERVIGNDAVEGGAEDIKAEVEKQFAALVAENKATFGNSETDFSSALTKSLSTTYFQRLSLTDDGAISNYGFVQNILLKLDQDSMDKIVEKSKSPGNDVYGLLKMRDEMIAEIKVKVANPEYSSTFKEKYLDAEGNEITDIIDPMTDPKNPYNGVGENKDTKYNAENNYDNIVSFEYNEEENKWEIKFNAEESPSMAYLIDEVPAYDNKGVGDNGKGTGAAHNVGIIQQIFNSFEAVTDAVENGVEVNGNNVKLTHVESVYWLRKMAETWQYLVGDDSGALSTESNNNGLGYLVTPDGQDSSFLSEFTDHARGLIKNGTGSYSTDGTVNGSYVIADSLISYDEDGNPIQGQYNTSSPYAGIFVVMVSNVAWDENAYTVVEKKDGDGNTVKDEYGNTVYEEIKIKDLDKYDGADPFAITKTGDKTATGTLPVEYIVTYGETLADCVTVDKQIRDTVETGKKAARYNMIVNTFGLKNSKNISYNAKVYESLWKNLDK